VRGRERKIRKEKGFALTFTRCSMEERENMRVLTACDVGRKRKKRGVKNDTT